MKKTLTIFLLFASIAAFSQTKNEKKGDDFYDIYYFDKAIKSYMHADSLSLVAQRNLAESFYNRFDFAQAEIEYEKFIESPLATINDYYTFILILKANEKYDEVPYWMGKIAEKKSDDLRVKDFNETKQKFDSLLIPNPKYTVHNLKMNTKDEDFGTCYYGKDKVVFTSSRSGWKPILRKYNWNREPFLDIFMADVNDSNELVKPRYFNKKYNKKWHEGPSSFNGISKFMAFTRNNYDGESEDDIVKLQLFFSEFKKGKWQEPDDFYLNSDEYSVGHPALTRNGRILFFASDMPGGYGGTDLYMVTKMSKNRWSEPINLGPAVNTEGNEMFPFYEDRNKLLFFASNGKYGLGGLDVYVAHATSSGFEEVKNIGAPINTSADDFAFIIDKKLKTGYFSSNRSQGKGGDDIYRFDYTGKFEMKKKIEQIPVTPKTSPKSASKSVTESAKQALIDTIDSDDSVQLVFKDSITNLTYNLLVINDQSEMPIKDAEVKIGKLLREYTDSLGLAASEFNILDTFKVVINAFGYKQEAKTVSLQKLRANKMVVNDTIRLKVAVDQRIVLKNIYYDFDRSNILRESSVELDKLVKFMNENPTVKVELSSHTDCRGSHKYNIGLSQRRANSAVRYVISKGISASRITARGYGETRLVNGCVDGVHCLERQHRQNRRTEIFIPGVGKALDIEQTKGKYSK